MRGTDKDEIIISILRESPKTNKELRPECLKRGIGSKPTYHRHLKKLIEQGIVKEAKYKLIEAEKEANPIEVKSHLNVLQKENNSNILIFRLKKLSYLSGSKRIAHIPNVLRVCEEALKDQKYQDTNVLKELIHLFEMMLGFERRSESPDPIIINRIQTNPLKSFIKISKTDTNFEMLRRIIFFLHQTENKESVDALFQLVERTSDEVYKNLEDNLIQILFNLNSTLENSQKSYIDENIDKLLRSTNPKTLERGIVLRNRSR